MSFNSSCSDQQRKNVMSELHSSEPELRLLYTTPESLLKPALREALVVGAAHAWGACMRCVLHAAWVHLTQLAMHGVRGCAWDRYNSWQCLEKIRLNRPCVVAGGSLYVYGGLEGGLRGARAVHARPWHNGRPHMLLRPANVSVDLPSRLPTTPLGCH
jgi:hypothetical protein